MRHAEHLTVLRAWCEQCLPGSVKNRRSPSRNSTDARVYGHTTTAMNELSSTPPPYSPPQPPYFSFYLTFQLPAYLPGSSFSLCFSFFPSASIPPSPPPPLPRPPSHLLCPSVYPSICLPVCLALLSLSLSASLSPVPTSPFFSVQLAGCLSLQLPTFLYTQTSTPLPTHRVPPPTRPSTHKSENHTHLGLIWRHSKAADRSWGGTFAPLTATALSPILRRQNLPPLFSKPFIVAAAVAVILRRQLNPDYVNRVSVRAFDDADLVFSLRRAKKKIKK